MTSIVHLYLLIRWAPKTQWHDADKLDIHSTLTNYVLKKVIIHCKPTHVRMYLCEIVFVCPSLYIVASPHPLCFSTSCFLSFSPPSPSSSFSPSLLLSLHPPSHSSSRSLLLSLPPSLSLFHSLFSLCLPIFALLSNCTIRIPVHVHITLWNDTLVHTHSLRLGAPLIFRANLRKKSDPSYSALQKVRPLDSYSSQRLNDIRANFLNMEQSIGEVNSQLDAQLEKKYEEKRQAGKLADNNDF